MTTAGKFIRRSHSDAAISDCEQEITSSLRLLVMTAEDKFIRSSHAQSERVILPTPNGSSLRLASGGYRGFRRQLSCQTSISPLECDHVVESQLPALLFRMVCGDWPRHRLCIEGVSLRFQSGKIVMDMFGKPGEYACPKWQDDLAGDLRFVSCSTQKHREQDWKQLNSSLAPPTERYAWNISATEVFGKNVHCFAVTDGNHHVDALALLNRAGVLQPLSQPGVEELQEPTDLLYRNPAALEVLTQELARHRFSICFYRLPADSATLPALRRAYKGRGLIRVSPQGSCPYIPLSREWIDPEPRLSRRLRSDLRRARKKADTRGGTSFVLHRPDKTSFTPLFHQALKVEDASWKGKTGSSLQRDPQRRRFFESYCLRAAERGELRIAFLYIGKEIAAMQIAAETGKGYWLYKVGYDRRFRACSPGMLLVLETLREAARTGLQSYQFLGYSSAWTRRWTELERPMVRVRTYALDGYGIGMLIKDAIRALLQRMKRRES